MTDAIGYINRDGCALVVDGTNALTGIVTVADLGERLADIATPFLELERCEQLLRKAVHDAEERLGLNLAVTAQSAHHSEGREVAVADDLTMGALVGILGADNVWPAEVAGHHTKTLRTRLGSVVEARNEVMHFRKLAHRN
ncbi:hypothetical protein [Agrococcus sp. Marseille-Q4369]|uniref:hypothetical protein n=1 Tax=Agrococcus sp. Marseille-Q4369 TaxID=2810513 RepID=UPI001B8ABD39|nr:hypothetical protein [Agrococcus sp. Marseille-Q4369]QUW17847.1 hypothetical protein JSQ78_08200 [Agrococcus sp. Marseille-Q4369]